MDESADFDEDDDGDGSDEDDVLVVVVEHEGGTFGFMQVTRLLTTVFLLFGLVLLLLLLVLLILPAMLPAMLDPDEVLADSSLPSWRR